MIVVPGPRNPKIARDLADILQIDLADVEHRRFPDGEAYFRIHTEVKGRDVVLVQNTYPDQAIVEFLLLRDLLIDLGASRIIGLVPYFGYARQDRRFTDGEAISASIIMNHIAIGLDLILTVDIHASHVLHGRNALNLYPAEEIAAFLRGSDCIIAPDRGALHRAEAIACLLGVEWDHLEKRRLNAENVIIETKSLDVAGRSVAIVDDIISTGGTIATAADHLLRQGAERVVAVCTHGLFTSGSIERLKGVCSEVACTDTLECEASVIPAAPCAARAIRSA